MHPCAPSPAHRGQSVLREALESRDVAAHTAFASTMARRRSVSWAAVTLAALLSVVLLAAPCEGAPKRGKQAPPPPPPPPPPTKGELFKQAALQLVTSVRTVVVPAATAAATHGRNAALAVYKGAGRAAAMAGVHMRAVVRAAAPVLMRTWDRVGQVDSAALHAKATPPAVVVILALLAVTALQRRSGTTGVKVRCFVPQQGGNNNRLPLQLNANVLCFVLTLPLPCRHSCAQCWLFLWAMCWCPLPWLPQLHFWRWPTSC